MHWLRKPGKNQITYTVVDGYSFQRELRERGFDYDAALKQWSLTVRRAQAERIERIEAFLKGLDRRSSPPVESAPQKPVRGRPESPELPWIDALLTQKSWLYQGETALLGRMRKQAQAGRRLSDGQLAKLREIRERVDGRKSAHIVPGGLPGLGKKR